MSYVSRSDMKLISKLALAGTAGARLKVNSNLSKVQKKSIKYRPLQGPFEADNRNHKRKPDV